MDNILKELDKQKNVCGHSGSFETIQDAINKMYSVSAKLGFNIKQEIFQECLSQLD
jgi:hypothetical protein